MTPPAATIRPPSLHRELVLPIVDVGSVRFEELCRVLVRIAFPDLVERAAMKRGRGVEQYGVDTEGFDEDGHPAVVVSAKCYAKIVAWDFRPWIQDFLDHVEGHWKGKRIVHFVLAIATEANDDGMNDQARELIAELKTRGIRFRLWDSVEITRMLLTDAATVDRFFNRYWTDAVVASRSDASQFNGSSIGGASATDPSTQIAMQLVVDAVSAPLLVQLNAAREAGLEDALRRLREGSPSSLADWLTSARADVETWPKLAVDVRAKALRASAMLQARAGDVEGARMVLDEADGLCDPPDAAARALLAYIGGDRELAMGALADRTVREREFAAALLIESDRAADALRRLADLTGSDVTSEILRLRAIATFIAGNRSRALGLAESAAARAPTHFAPAMTLAIVRFHLALADGVRPRLAGSPNPLSPGLVKGTEAALSMLDLAIAGFDRLRQTVEGPLRRECEIWHLASLLLHPGRRAEASASARSLLAGDDPDPLAVVWCLNFGLVRRPGRIKKALGDAIRTGRAEPTHLVALAVMSATVERPGRGAAVIERYADRFPEAADFLAGWRAQFGGGDPEDRPVYATAVRRLLATGDAEPLVSHLAAGHVEDLLPGSEILAGRKAWASLDSLRSRLVALATSQALQLAAMGAMGVGDAEGCLAILGSAETDGVLPRRFVYFRIGANQALGRHRPVISDLEALVGAEGDEHVDERLLDAYGRIGALTDFEAVARRALARGGLDAGSALRIADVLRTTSPEVARLALGEAARRGIGPELAGAALSLAAVLGVAPIQSDMLRLLSSGPAGPALRSFSGIDEFMAFVKERAAASRSLFDDWLSGRSPAAITMTGDLRAYACLFMAAPDERRNDVGDPFPMLLRSGATRPPASAVPPAAPLRVDLGALLLAFRLDLVSAIEEAFPIQVPPSLPEALREMEASLALGDAEVVEAMDEVLTPGRGHLRIDAEAPAETRSIDDPDADDGMLAPVVAGLIEAAFREGHLDEAGRRHAFSFLLGEVMEGEPVEAVLLTPRALVRLAASGVVDALARAVPLHLSPADAERCRRDVRRWRHDRILLERVRALRILAADRLALGRWTTIPASALLGLEDPFRAPPHVRCMLEVVAAQNAVGGRFWIEDRFVSNGRLDGSLDVLEIVDRLRAEGHVDEPRRRAVVLALEDAGYAYMPIDRRAVYAAIAAASIADGRLVETSDLARARRRYAREADLLAHVDRHVVPGPDGSIASEARRLVEVLGCARELLLAIWSDATATPSERATRSRWVWTCMNPLDAPRPLDDETLRVAFAAGVLAHVADIALLGALGDGEAGDAARGLFVAWFVEIGFDPFASGDPSAADALAEVMAVMILRLLSDMDPNPVDDPEGVRALFTALARRFLRTLPDHWRERVLDRHDLRSRLGMAKVMICTLDDGPSVAVQALVAAAAEALAGAADAGEGVAPLELVDGTRASIRIEIGNAAPRRHVVALEGRDFVLDPLSCALIEPEGRIRIVAMTTLLQGSGLSVSDLRDVAGIVDLQARFHAFERLLDEDLPRRLALMHQRFATLGPTLDDFDPPTATSVWAYLASSGAEDRPRMAGGLHARVERIHDAREAAFRLAALPFEPPTGFLERYGARLLDPEAGPHPIPETPLQAFFRLRALHAAGADAADLETAIGDLDATSRRVGRLFSSLVRHVTMRSLLREDWLDLDPEDHLALAWVFADQVAGVLVGNGADLDAFAEALRRSTSSSVAMNDIVASRPGWWRRLSYDLNDEVLAGAMVATVVRAGIGTHVSPESIAILEGLVGRREAAGLHPSAGLLAIPTAAPEGLPFGCDPVGVLGEAGWIDEDAWFFVRDDVVLGERIAQGAGDRDRSMLIPALLSFVAPSRLSREVARDLADLVERIDAEGAFEPDGGIVQRALRARATLLARIGEVDAMHAALSRQARRCASRWPFAQGEDASKAVLAFTILSDAAFEHAKRLEGDRSEWLATFARGVEAVLEGWPAAAPYGLEHVGVVVRQAGVEAAARLQPLFSGMMSRC